VSGTRADDPLGHCPVAKSYIWPGEAKCQEPI
jgi:hypothetical protein